MEFLKNILKGLGFALIGLALLCLIFFLFNFLGFYFVLLLCAFYTWLAFAFFHYRYVRQEEMLGLLQSAVDSNLPVAAVLRAFLHDRPSGWTRETILAVSMFLIFPGYYWFWHRGRDFDSRLKLLLELLESGFSLSEALQVHPSLVSRDVLLAVALGESSGKIPEALRAIPRWQQDRFWLTSLPRIAYVLAVTSFTLIVVGFFMVYILPRFKKIFMDFSLQLPAFSRKVFDTADFLLGTPFPLLFLFLVTLAIFMAAIWSSTVRWYFPVAGTLYRIQVQGNFLRMLGLALQSQESLPRALAVLLGSGFFPTPARMNLVKLINHVEKGGSLPSGLEENGWTPPAMKGLFEAAERLGNLPWALMEAGLQRSRVASLLANRLTFTVFPLMLLALGALVGMIAVAMFLPLVELIMELA
ncbi:MAG: hypothetical protein EXR99_03565 [Gemmataceae bacterium]|nr:hypothetical protein [Gemmataceae bacterium]